MTKPAIESRHGDFATRYAERVTEKAMARLGLTDPLSESYLRSALRTAVLEGARREQDVTKGNES